FIMQPEGVSGLFVRERMADGPFPEHYEPMETPIGTNPLHPNVVSSPVARILASDKEDLGTSADFPYVGTTYRLTEHFHYWTKNVLLNVIAQPEQFVEIGEALAAEKGIKHGDIVKVSSKRGYIKAVAVVTKRIRALVSVRQANSYRRNSYSLGLCRNDCWRKRFLRQQLNCSYW
ncbi:FdxG, partial [Pasteurella multocida subsp. multocida str. Anand1_buffalo]